jgi:hypothetical protein
MIYHIHILMHNSPHFLQFIPIYKTHGTMAQWGVYGVSITKNPWHNAWHNDGTMAQWMAQ